MDREAWNRRYAGSELVWTAEPNRFLVAEVGDLPSGRALDLACGEGRNAVWLSERGWEVVGVDFSDVALGKARRLADARGVQVEWRVADLLAFRPEPGRYDLVLVFYLQLPAHERRPVLAHAAGAVAPGGTFLLVGHDRQNLERGFGGPSDPDVLLDADEVAGELPGLEVERAEQVLRPVQGERDAIDTVVRARRSA